eukprot:gene4599-biopygen6867
MAEQRVQPARPAAARTSVSDVRWRVQRGRSTDHTTQSGSTPSSRYAKGGPAHQPIYQRPGFDTTASPSSSVARRCSVDSFVIASAASSGGRGRMWWLPPLKGAVRSLESATTT